MPAATATSRRAAPPAKTLKRRREVAEELLGIHRRLKLDFDRMEVLEVELKAIATATGESFTEEFAGRGKVGASGKVAAEYKGLVPQIQTEAWNALKALERKRLEKCGLVALEKQWGKASNGRVNVKVFGEAE